MPAPGLRWFTWIAIAIAVVVAVPTLLWAIAVLWQRLSPPWDSPTLIATAILALAFLTGVWWLWWRLPRRQVARLALKICDPKDRADAEDNFRKTIGQALGGAAVLIGAGVAYLQFSQQQHASHDLLISNQLAKGFEQLGNEKLETRIGGIYTLQGVLNDSEEYHQPVLEALCAMIIDLSRNKGRNEIDAASDIQAALTTLSEGFRRRDLNLILEAKELDGSGLNYSPSPCRTLYRQGLLPPLLPKRDGRPG